MAFTLRRPTGGSALRNNDALRSPSAAPAHPKARRRQRYGTVVHEITSHDGAFCLKASDQWEAMEIAPGGYEGAREMVPAKWVRRYPHVFTPGAKWVSRHEQTGDIVWAGEIADALTPSGSFAAMDGDGSARKARRRVRQLFYQATGSDDWQAISGNGKWTVTNEAGEGLSFDRSHVEPTSDFQDGAEANYSVYKPNAIEGPLTRLSFQVSLRGHDDARATIDVRAMRHDNELPEDLVDGEVEMAVTAGGGLVSSAEFDLDLTHDVDSNPIEAISVSIGISDWSGTDAELYSFQGCSLKVFNQTVNGICPAGADGGISPNEYSMTISQVVRDLAARMGLGDSRVEEFGFDAMPLDVRDGTYEDVLLEMSVLANARHMIYDTDNRSYLDFAKWNRDIYYHYDSRQPVNLDPLPRYDHVTIPYTTNDRFDLGISGGYPGAHYVTVWADRPFDYPRGYGRLRLPRKVRNSEKAFNLGERLIDHLYKQRWGGSAQVHSVLSSEGEPMSALLMKAGSTYKVPHRSATARVVGKRSTIRNVTLDFERDYAPVDRYLARKAKRMERA